MKGLIRGLAVAVAMLVPAVTTAQEFPTRVIRIVAGVTPGGGLDSAARILANELGKALPQPVIIDNRGGAGGSIGADVVAKAEPDGHTLLMAAPGNAVINPHLIKNLSYKYEDLTPVALIGLVPLVVIVRSENPIRSLADFVAAAMAQPGALNYGTPGVGTSNHMATVMFEVAAGVKLTHVPYRGPEANSDLLAGRLDFIFDAITTASPLIAAGKVRPLAVTTLRRAPALPDVPAISELGYPDFDSTNWYGILAPAKTPAPVIARLNRLIVAAIEGPDAKPKLEHLGLVLKPGTPADFKTFADAQYRKMGEAVRASGIQPE